MTPPRHRQDVLDAIARLVDEIVRLAPDCADRALQIGRLVEDLDAGPDPATVSDALSAETVDSDISETKVRAATKSVVDALRATPND